jgi:DNA polymerase III delta prime subunit
MVLREAKTSLYDEVVNFAKHNIGDHSYNNFKSHSSEYISEGEYANIYWTLVNTNEITEGPKAPPKKKQEEILGYLEQRVNQLTKKANKEKNIDGYKEKGFSKAAPPKEDKTGIYDKYRSSEEVPDDLKASFEDDDDVEISNDSQSAKDIFDEMNAYVSSIMQKRSTKPHLIIAGAPGTGKTTEIENHAKDYLLPGWELVSESGTIGNSMTAVVPFMYKHSQQKIIILDDINTIFRTNYRDPVLNFMMAILDKKASTTKPVKIDKSQLSRYNKQLEESVEIFIDKEKLKEGILSIKANNEEVFNEHISLQESQELYHMIIPPKEKIQKNKYGFLKEASNKEFFNDLLDDEEDEDIEESDYDDYGDYDDESNFDPTQVPERFLFNSRIIMITNVKMSEINQAFRDRCLVFFIELSVDQYIERLDTVLPNILKDDLDVSPEIISWAKDYSHKALVSTLRAFKHNYSIPYKSNGQALAVTVEINRDLTFRLFEELVQKWIVFATKRLGNNIKNASTREEMSKKLIKPFVILYVLPFLKASA